MILPVSDADFWKGRIERAAREGREHYSVYLARNSLWKEIEDAHREILRKECPGYRVLDAGCGYGRASEWLEDLPGEYTGVDSSPDFIAMAQQKYPRRRFSVENLKQLPFKDGQFDVAFCISIKNMIVGNLGNEEWEAMERELLRVADRLLILEYENPDLYYIV